MRIRFHGIAKAYTSFRTAVVLLMVYVLLLAAATIIEAVYGTPVALEVVYHSPLFFLLQLLMVAHFIAYAYTHHYMERRRVGLVLTHIAFVVILLGAGITHLMGREGVMHIREGETSDVMTVHEKGASHTVHLPFRIRLDDFRLVRYPGSDAPSAYESRVTVFRGNESRPALIYMNNVLDIGGYRLFQTSFDGDERGTLLTVNHDPWGRTLTYTGYALLAVGLLFSLLGRQTRVRTLYRKLSRLQGAGALLLALPLWGCGSAPSWDEVQPYVPPAAHAEKFGKLPVQSPGGRTVAVSSYASELLRKMHGAETPAGLSPEQVLLSMFLVPDVWADVPLVRVDDKDLAGRYGLGVPYCTPAEVWDTAGEYKLRQDLEALYGRSAGRRDAKDKALLRLNERANLAGMLLGRNAFRLFPLPDDPGHRWFSPGDDLSAFTGKDSMFVSRIFDWYLEEVALAMQSGNWDKADEVLGMISTYQKAKSGLQLDGWEKRAEAEIRYNRLQVFRHCKTGYLVLGAGVFALALFSLLGGGRHRGWNALLSVPILGLFLFQTYGMGLRWYISGHAPLSNGYETMVYVAWATVAAGLWFARRSRLVFGLAVWFAGIVLWVSELSRMDPDITPLVPVLKSPWLMIHVAVIVASYGFFGLSHLVGLTNLFLLSFHRAKHGTKIEELSILNEISMWMGLILMVAGTFLGAVWAGQSWGRYWGWDPKETWALITIVVYALVTHLHLLRPRKYLWLLNVLSVLAFLSVLMTFFGVNWLLSGLHSYS